MALPVVVIGGGITGLAAAHRIGSVLGARSVVLVEGATRVGGKIATTHADGCALEDGPDCFLASKPAGVALCELLGLGAHIIGTNNTLRRSFVKRGGRLFPLPDGLTGLVPSRLAPLVTTGVLSLKGRARAAIEPLIPRSRNDDDESVGTFVRRRFGAEAWQWLVEPLLSGIYAGDGDTLSLRATFPQLREAERRHGSVVRPLVTAARPRIRTARRGFVSLTGGMQQLVDALANQLPVSARTGSPAVAISRTAAGYLATLGHGEVLDARAVVLATPAHATARLVRALDPNLAGALMRIPFVSTATVTLAFARADVPSVLPGFGYVSPRAEGGAVVACTWTSNKFPTRAPAGHVLVRVFIGRAGNDAVVRAPDDELIALARDELAAVHGIRATPRLTRIVRWLDALPQYTMGHDVRLAEITARAAAHPRVVLAGASYHGVGIPDCIASGWAAADRVVEQMRVL